MTHYLTFVVLALSLDLGYAQQTWLYTHQWLNKRSLPVATSDLTATTVGDAILLAGGCTGQQNFSTDMGFYGCTEVTNKAYVYYPLTDTYEDVADMPRIRYRHAAVAVESGDSYKVYVFGGVTLSDEMIDEVDMYDVSTKSWSTLPERHPSPKTDVAGFKLGTKIYMIGGYNTTTYVATNETWVLDTANTTAGWTSAPAMPSRRGDLVAVTINGTGYVFGGFTHENDFKSPVADLESFDGTSWTELPDMEILRGDKAGAVINDRFQVIGGETKNTSGASVPISDVEVYDPVTGKWTHEGHVPTQRFRFVAAGYMNEVFVFGGQGFLVGTYNGNGSYYPIVNTVEAFQETKSEYISSPATMNVWTKVSVFFSVLTLYFLF